MVRLFLGLVLMVASATLMHASSAYADSSLRLQPLQYVEALQKGERKRAFIDVTNPSTQPVIVQFNVRAFRQTDSKGTLSFYDDERVKNGVLLDYQEKEIPAKKTLRLFFLVDGTKLPAGDVFAVIFAQTKSGIVSTSPSVQIGTLLILTNGTPSTHRANIESIELPFIIVGNSVDGQLKVRNTAPASSASGFFPKITINTWPFGPKTTITGPLVYAGNSRSVHFSQSSNQLGIYKITAHYEGSSKAQWVILITGVWRSILAIGFGVLFMTAIAYKMTKNRRKNNA